MIAHLSQSFDISARSLIGLIRSGNEDSALVHPRLIAVADGMGGHAGGEVASSIAIKTLAKFSSVLHQEEIDPDSLEDLLTQCLVDINLEINRVADVDSDLLGMGSTLTALLLYGGAKETRVALLHIGDSRCYRLRGNELLQMSHDHTVLQELLDQGAITLEEALVHPQRSYLTQALMGETSITPILIIHAVEEGDRFLLCSDGLSGALSFKEIKSAMRMHDREKALEQLIEAVYEAGAPDNVTVVIADLTYSTPILEATLLGAAQ